MATIQHVLTNMTLFVDGRGYAGKVSELKPPTIKPMVREYKAGGLSAPYPYPMGAVEKMEAEFTLTGFDPDVLKLIKLVPGQTVPMRFVGALYDHDGTCRQVEVSLRGVFEEIDHDAWKPNDEVNLKGKVFASYYQSSIAGEVLHEIDPINMVAIINGQDQMAEMRAALGV